MTNKIDLTEWEDWAEDNAPRQSKSQKRQGRMRVNSRGLLTMNANGGVQKAAKRNRK